jgi:hypothetical protein
VQVLPTGILLTVCVGEPAVRFKVTLGPEGEQATLTGKTVPAGGAIEVRFMIVFVTVNDPVQMSGTVTEPEALYWRSPSAAPLAPGVTDPVRLFGPRAVPSEVPFQGRLE